MNLTVRIHDKEYPIAQGATFSEEYNETLDSGAIRIPHVIGQIDNLRPYDDVYIYDSEYNFDKHIAEWRQSDSCSDNPFYRHLLINQYTEEVVNLVEGIYSYSIELFSETKGLEMVQVPNISVTQPLNMEQKVDIYKYLCRFVELYSPKYKTVDRSSTTEVLKWVYAPKYRVSPSLQEIFGGVYSQDFTLSNPTLRDVLSTLMITKDMIPYVKDGVIYAKAISERTDTYDIETEKNSGRINLVVGQMSSADYCDGVRRQYSDALSQDGTCNFIEYLGFRNKGNALMTLDNMQIETTHKIYKIKKFYMCYYKKALVYKSGEEPASFWMLCKQDITPLIKLESEWGLLSQDWTEINDENSPQTTPPQTIKDLSEYKLTTVPYSIGGKSITGWGTRYNEYRETALSVYDITKTYIENIFVLVDKMRPYGVFSEEELKEYYIKNIDSSLTKDMFAVLPTTPYEGSLATNVLSHVFTPDEEINSTLKFKTFFFEIEYSGFYDGALIHSRDKGNDNLFQNDNQSSSLTLLEKDGFSQKEKLNRFANKTYTMKGRLDGDNYGVDKLLNLGETGIINETDDDVIIYRREYSIYDNYILVSYAGVQDYVLKNFYTSVYAKYRTNQLMSYGESTNRAETKKVMLLLSKDKKYKDEETFLKIENGQEDVTSAVVFSAFKPNDVDKSINNGVVLIGGSIGKDYNVDIQSFTSGNSLCFNIAMEDNASGGNWIKNYVSDYQMLSTQPSEDKDYYVGSEQDWLDIVDDKKTGAIEKMGFDFSHVDRKPSMMVSASDVSEIKNVYRYSKQLPRKTSYLPSESTNRIVLSKDQINKDNKDRIDMTIQIEPISCEQNDIVFGEHFMKLSDLVTHNKYEESKEIYSYGKETQVPNWRYVFTAETFSMSYLGTIVITPNVLNTNSVDDLIEKINNTEVNLLNFDVKIDFSFINQDVVCPFSFYAKYISCLKDERELANASHPYKIRLIGAGVTQNGEVISSLDFYYNYNETLGEYCYEATLRSDVANISPSKWEFKGGVVELVPQYTEISPNMFIECSNKKVDKTSSYDILVYPQPAHKFTGIKPSEVFEVMDNGTDSYIRVRLRSDSETKGEYKGEFLSGIGIYTQSIVYWYFDFDAAYEKTFDGGEYVYHYTPQQSCYRFVFGVNITSADKERGYVDVYITQTTHRDIRTFDSVGRQVGVVHNCVEVSGDEVSYQKPSEYIYDSINEIDKCAVITTVMPENSGTIVGGGLYYVGEIANLEFTPNEGNIFYRWKQDDEILDKKDPFVSSKILGNTEFIAQCGVDYRIWNDGLCSKVTTNNESVPIYSFDASTIGEDILKISSINMIVYGKSILGDNTPYTGSFSINPSEHISEDTASKAIILLDGGTVKLNFWIEHDKDTGVGIIYAKGYKKYLGKKYSITISIGSLSMVLVEEPKSTKIALDFSDENILSIYYEYSVATDTPGVSNLYYNTISRDNENIIDNKYILEDIPYGVALTLYANVDMVNYTTKYNQVNSLNTNMGVDMVFAPTATLVTEEDETTIWESEEGETLEYGYIDGGILGPLPQSLILDAISGYDENGVSYDAYGLKFVLDIDGEEKSFISLGAEAVEIADGITLEMRGLMGNYNAPEDKSNTLFTYLMLPEDATEPVVKLKKIIER